MDKNNKREEELTEEKVADYTHPTDGEVWVWDTEIKGLALRITPNSKTYVVRKWLNTAPCTASIGKYPLTRVHQARDQARALLAQIVDGINPNDLKRENVACTVTLKQVLDDYIQQREGTMKKATADDYQKVVNRCLGDWLKNPVALITKDMVAKRHQKLSTNPYQADLAMRILRALLNFASTKYQDSQGEPIIKDNPVKKLSQQKAWKRLERRHGMIKDQEFPVWYQAVNELQNETLRDYLLLALFTGLRRSQLATLRWDDIDFNNRFILIQEGTHHQLHALPLTPYMTRLLHARWQKRTNQFVFAGTGRTGHIVEPKTALQEIARKTNIKFMVDDLRRTFLNVAEGLELSPDVLKRLANFKTNAGFVTADVERLRQPMEQISEQLLERCNQQVPQVSSPERFLSNLSRYQQTVDERPHVNARTLCDQGYIVNDARAEQGDLADARNPTETVQSQ